MKGTVIQSLSGLYQVITEEGAVRCRPRGIFRKNNITICSGDSVEIEIVAPGEGMINEILPRRNSFIRPKVANIDLICYVLSSRYPEPDSLLIDKMTVLAELKQVEILLILNKVDLDTDHSASKLMNLYEQLGYNVIRCTAINMEQAGQIIDFTAKKTAVLTGNTGVGKSSILNTLDLGVSARVEEISYKLGRGRHTTREVTFYLREDGGMLADTPGFGNIDITLEDELTPNNLADYFVEFRPWNHQCRFADCMHAGEDGCIVADKVACGEISQSRYANYRQILSTLIERDMKKVAHLD